MKIILIAGMAENRVIGKDNKLPWNIPEDLQNFKKLTSGNVIVMGRKTYESIGRPLPNRRNIILSSKEVEGVETYQSIEKLIQKLENENVEQIFVIGGTQIYDAFLKKGIVTDIYLSLIHGEYEGDAFFPVFEDDFREVYREKFNDFDFIHYTSLSF